MADGVCVLWYHKENMEIVFLFAIVLSMAAIGGLLYFQNKELVLSRHTIGSEFLPKEFDGFTIVHLSDLHNKQFGKGQWRLIGMVRKARPDIIVMTGDMVDSTFYHSEPTVELMRGLREMAPIYYVTGNHEWSRPELGELLRQFAELGVSVLDNRVEIITRGDKEFAIAGIDDRARYVGEEDSRQTLHRELDRVRHSIDERAFKILLAHRPELLHEYMQHHFSIVFSGHAHGGQWDLPVIGPVFAPGQGLFPKLVSGVHKRHNTHIVISRGIGNSGIAFQRLFNKPEVVVVVLKNLAGK